MQVFAQKRQNIYFLKDNGRFVKSIDSADYVRVIQEPDSGSTLFNLLEFYRKDNKYKRVGHVSAFEPAPVLEGTVLSYYKSGSKQEVVTYERNVPRGPAVYYYENGKVQKTLEYGDTGTAQLFDLKKTIYYKIISYYDSTGVQTVENGNGHIKVISGPEKSVEEEGDIRDGVKEGTWKGAFLKTGNRYEELFSAGKFVSGVATLSDETTYEYRKNEEPPEFNGGEQGFLRFVQRTFRYPADAIKTGVSGRVILSFVVEKDGSVSDIKVLRSVSPSIDEEAIRTLRISRNWKPGRQHGIPVRVAVTLPLALNLGAPGR
ncbi:TonB family protein [Hufsiella ginkgonis]|uniref:TonB family protein n=1 Tax=Hufsiella ginkgonis TaxID=2695274 RepID=A0A7K1XS80_9SPHI|nr:TonB family protein [Hufsiella ginkgonis]